MKKWLVILVTLALVFAFAACGNEPAAPPAEETPADTETPAAEEGDHQYRAAIIFNVSDPYNGGGFERMMLEGVEAVKSELGWQVDVAEGVELSKVYEVAAGYADEGYDAIFFPGGEFYDAWYALPEAYPDTWFLEMSLVPDYPSVGKAAANKSDKFSYGVIVGGAMSMISESGTIGVVGGMPVGGVLKEFSGIIEGAEAAVPGTEVLFGWTGEYEDITNHYEVTKQLIEQGADVLFTATGPGYKGVWQAGAEFGCKVIGYCYDSYNIDPEVITGSVAYDGPAQFLAMCRGIVDGTAHTGFYEFGYEIVRICDWRGAISDEKAAEIDDFYNKVLNGEIVVAPVDHEF